MIRPAASCQECDRTVVFRVSNGEVCQLRQLGEPLLVLRIQVPALCSAEGRAQPPQLSGEATTFLPPCLSDREAAAGQGSRVSKALSSCTCAHKAAGAVAARAGHPRVQHSDSTLKRFLIDFLLTLSSKFPPNADAQTAPPANQLQHCGRECLVASRSM